MEFAKGTARVIVNGSLISVADQFVRSCGHIGLEVKRGGLEVRSARVERRDTYFAAPTEAPGTPRAASPGVTTPRLRREVKPDYSVVAMEQGKQGFVELVAVVLPDGTVGRVAVTKSLDLDLDQAAVAAMRRWTFVPGQKDGQPVAVIVNVEMSFTLR